MAEISDCRASTVTMSTCSSDQLDCKMLKRPKVKAIPFREFYITSTTDISEDHISGIDNFRKDGESVADKEPTQS